MTVETLFSAYLDLNIVLLCAVFLWGCARLVWGKSALNYAYSSQLKLIYATLLLVALTPALASFYKALQIADQIPRGYHLSVADYALSQFLNGRIDMAASQFEWLLMARTQFTHDIITLNTPVGVAIAAALAGGVLLAFVQSIWSASAVARIVSRSYAWRKFGRVRIWVSDEVQVPFSTRGLWHSHIVVPSHLLTQSGDLRIAVSHELQHIRQGDLGWEIVLEALRPLFFWNPAFGIWKREVERVRELACDQQVLRRETYAVLEYCDCLLRVCRNSLQHRAKARLLQPSVPFVQAEAGSGRAARLLKSRVLSMSQDDHRPYRYGFALIAAPMTIAIVMGVFAMQTNKDWSHDRLMLSTIVNLERLDLRTKAAP